MTCALDGLEKRLNYQFIDKTLFALALTHSSAAKNNNERLEFLGDAIVNFVVGNYLFDQFPQAQEGQLSRMRASLVKGETLATLAQFFKLSEIINVGPGEMRTGGNYRSSILAGTMEALIGAVYIDRGFEICRQCILCWYGSLLTSITIEQQHIDAKTQLQELLQSRHLTLPHYVVLQQTGKAHRQLFSVECRVASLNTSSQAQGNNRRQAEQAAAAIMLERLL